MIIAKAICIVINKQVVERVPKRFRTILLREIKPLMADENVLAIGLTGSLARGDVWDGSDIDIDVILQGDRPFGILLKFEETEINITCSGESQAEKLPYDVVPIYDPHHIIEGVIKKRDPKKLILKMIDGSIERSNRNLANAKTFLNSNRLYSCLSYIHQAAEEIAAAFILLMREAPSIRRTISRLESTMKKNGSHRPFLRNT